jgi:hypothetical protein
MTDGMTDHLELADAARRMGLSSEALKKRLIRGTVPGRKVDGRWVVLAEGLNLVYEVNVTPPPDTRHDGQDDVTPDVTTRDDGRHDSGVTPSPRTEPGFSRDALIERLHRENVELAGRIGWLMAELEAARQAIRQLSAPANVAQCNNEPPVETAPTTTPAPGARPEPAQAPLRPRWWQFWRWGEAQPAS